MCDLTGATLLTTVTSEPTPQEGQNERSSGNFSTEGAPSDSTIIWVVGDNDHADTISFDVKEDKTLASDPVIWPGVFSCSQNRYESSRSFYIANPAGAGVNNFTVSVYYK